MQTFNQTTLEAAWTPGRKDYPGHSLTVTIKGTFRLQPNGVATLVDAGDVLLVDGDRHIGDDTGKSLEYATDFAFYKPATDILMKGSCHTPEGEALPVCPVSFGLEGEQQSLYVFGDRQWQKSLLGGKEASKAEPFTRMPLCFENSFGGEGFDANPVGKGVNDERLPNIEHPDFLIVTPDDRPQPVGFAPLHSLWQPRKTKMGTFSKQWQEERWPWFPEDMDWSLFNAAPTVLQRPGFLKGDETLVMENLHPRVPNYRCQLPALRSRCFINGENADQVENFREVSLNLDTLWVDADEELMVLVWRGVLPIADRFHDELDHLLLVTEPLASEPQAEQVYRDKLADELKALQPEVTPPVKPVEDPAAPPKEEVKVDEEVKKALDEARASLKGLDLPKETLDALNKEQDAGVFLDTLMKALGISSEDADKLQHEVFLKNRQLLEDQGHDPNLAGRLKVERIESREDVIRYHAEGRDFTGADLSNLDLNGLDLQNAEFSHTLLVNTQLNNSNLNGANLSHARLNKVDLNSASLDDADLTQASLRECELIAATLVAARLDDARLEHADLTRADLTQAQLHKVHFEQCILLRAKLTDADISEASLIQADLSHADLTECNASLSDFSESKLDGANMEYIDLSGARLSRASLQQTNLSGALLGNAQMHQANMQGAILTGALAESAMLDQADLKQAKLDAADFSAASFNQASLTGASLTSAMFRKAHLEHATLESVNAASANFSEAQMANAKLQNSLMIEAEFSGADVSDADFNQADLTRAIFTATQATGANMYCANLTELRAGGGSNFDHANLEQVTAPDAIWMQSSMRQANLKWADMPRNNLNQTDMSGARCVAADIKQSDLTRANLKGANFTDCNFFQSQFECANITHTQFSGSNMYSAFFLDTFIDEGSLLKSDFQNTNLKRTRIDDWDDTV